MLGKLRKLEFKSAWDIVREEKADSIDDFFWDDPLVFLGEVLAYLKTTLIKRSINPAEEGMLG